MASPFITKLKLPVLLLLLQIVFIVLFAFTVEYDISADARGHQTGAHDENGTSGLVEQPLPSFYPMFQDVHVMIFIGFGFLMTFLKRYGYSAVGINMLLAALTIQWATLVQGYFHSEGKVHISIESMLTADFAAAAVLITYGAVLGKTSPLQLVIIAVLEIVVFSLNEWIGVSKLLAVDIGGSMFVHAFGAYFGLAVSRVLYHEDVEKSTKEGSVYHSDIFSMIGTIFLWLFWPSFNSALAPGDDQHRAVLNTYFALAACCVVTFAISSIVEKNGKFDMVHVQNATLAGGVAVGTSADMMIGPHGALLIGSAAAILSVIGYKFITPFLNAKFKLHDTCGVNNLHGMPAILAAVAGSIAAAVATTDKYGYSLYEQFPARVPKINTSELNEVRHYVSVKAGEGRTAGAQAGFQILALIVTIILAVVGGLITGAIIRFVPHLGRPLKQRLFEDEYIWLTPDESVEAEIEPEEETKLKIPPIREEFPEKKIFSGTKPNILQESGAPLLVEDTSRDLSKSVNETKDEFDQSLNDTKDDVDNDPKHAVRSSTPDVNGPPESRDMAVLITSSEGKDEEK